MTEKSIKEKELLCDILKHLAANGVFHCTLAKADSGPVGVIWHELTRTVMLLTLSAENGIEIETMIKRAHGFGGRCKCVPQGGVFLEQTTIECVIADAQNCFLQNIVSHRLGGQPNSSIIDDFCYASLDEYYAQEPNIRFVSDIEPPMRATPDDRKELHEEVKRVMQIEKDLAALKQQYTGESLPLHEKEIILMQKANSVYLKSQMPRVVCQYNADDLLAETPIAADCPFSELRSLYMDTEDPAVIEALFYKIASVSFGRLIAMYDDMRAQNAVHAEAIIAAGLRDIKKERKPDSFSDLLMILQNTEDENAFEKTFKYLTGMTLPRFFEESILRTKMSAGRIDTGLLEKLMRQMGQGN